MHGSRANSLRDRASSGPSRSPAGPGVRHGPGHGFGRSGRPSGMGSGGAGRQHPHGHRCDAGGCFAGADPRRSRRRPVPRREHSRTGVRLRGRNHRRGAGIPGRCALQPRHPQHRCGRLPAQAGRGGAPPGGGGRGARRRQRPALAWQECRICRHRRKRRHHAPSRHGHHRRGPWPVRRGTRSQPGVLRASISAGRPARTGSR